MKSMVALLLGFGLLSGCASEPQINPMDPPVEPPIDPPVEPPIDPPIDPPPPPPPPPEVCVPVVEIPTVGAQHEALATARTTRTARPLDARAIDLGDAAQYRLVMNRLAAAGKTAATAPALYDRVQRARRKAIARASSGGTSDIAEAVTLCAIRIQLGAEQRVEDTVVFPDTHVDVSCVGPVVYVYADITTFDANAAGTEQFVVATAAAEQYGDGKVFNPLSINPALPAVGGRVNQTESLLIAFDEADNEQFVFASIKSHVVPKPGVIKLAHPTVHDGIANDGSIEMCQLRGAPSHCDYGVGSLSGDSFRAWTQGSDSMYSGIAAVKAGTGTTTVPWQGDPASYFAFATPYTPDDLTHVFLPIEGIVDAGSTDAGDCVIKEIEIAEFRLSMPVTGGMCTTASSFKDSFTVRGDSRTATFRAISDFTSNSGTDGDCDLAAIIRNEGSKPALVIQMRVDCGTGTLVPRVASLAPSALNSLPARVSFLDRCVAEPPGGNY